MARQSTGLGTPIAMFGILAAGLLIILSQKKTGGGSEASTNKSLTSAQQDSIVKALQALGIDETGGVKSRSTPQAVRHARALAKNLAALGFPDAAATLNRHADLAESARWKGTKPYALK